MGILRTDKISGLETPTAVTGSVVFDGSGDVLTIGSGSHNRGEWNFLHNGLSDWTVEFWAKTGAVSRQFPWGTGGSSAQVGTHMYIMSTADAQADGRGIYVSTGRGSPGDYRYYGADNCLIENTWHHIAAVFKSSDKTLAIYVDGKQVSNDTGTAGGTFSLTQFADSNSSFPLTLGQNPHGSGNDVNGTISNLRITAGYRVYTSEFTPPVHALEPINGTAVLCCNNPDSVTASSRAGIGTAHTVTTSGNPTVGTDNSGLSRDFTYGTEFRGVTTFDTQGYFVPPSGTTEQRGRGRGVFSAGTTPNDNTSTNTIDYITIATLGNSQDFGDTTESLHAGSSGSDSTRGLFSGGAVAGNNTNYNTISYITIATTSNAVNFGDLSGLKRYSGSTSDKTRTVIAGGKNHPGPTFTTIEYVTTQALGDAQTFGDLSTGTWAFTGTASSSTRGIYFGGSPGGSSDSINTIVYVTIQSLGDAQDFGDLTNVNSYTGPGGIVSSTTRGIRGGGGGADPFTRVNTIDYVTMATLGNAQDFGDLSYSANGVMGCSSLTRGIFAGGKTGSGSVNTIEYVTIASTGNAQDFGDMRGTYAFSSALSDSHGGLS